MHKLIARFYKNRFNYVTLQKKLVEQYLSTVVSFIILQCLIAKSYGQEANANVHKHDIIIGDSYTQNTNVTLIVQCHENVRKA